ncbi:MAG: hypothetical protein SFY66_26935 [Oculatellaceae cyanobacterium bins.114]|nr:hypothetical protein [Oculatellaceae cyanobacterium bins.114]
MMNPLSSDHESTSSVQPHQLLVVQPCGHLDLTFQTILERAIHQAVKVVVVDLIKVTHITPDAIQALQTALKLATSLSKELVVWSADAATYTALNQERDRQQVSQLSDRTEVMQSEFSQFLNCRRQKTTKPSLTPVASPLLRPVPTIPVLSAAPYTTANWHTAGLLSDIA